MAESSAQLDRPRDESSYTHPIEKLRHLAFDMHRRRVYRAVVTYAFAAWLVLQIADIAFPLFGVSSWTFKLVACMTALGLPITVIVAWIYQITPLGIVVDPGDGGSARASRQDFFIVLLTILGAAAVLLLLGASGPGTTPTIAITATDLRPPDVAGDSIAPGLEEELRRQLLQGSSFEPISAESAWGAAGFMLWVSVQARPENVRVRTLLLEADGNGAYPYLDAFDLPGGAPGDVQREAAHRIAGRLHRVLAAGSGQAQLSRAAW